MNTALTIPYHFAFEWVPEDTALYCTRCGECISDLTGLNLTTVVMGALSHMCPVPDGRHVDKIARNAFYGRDCDPPTRASLYDYTGKRANDGRHD